MTTSNISEPRKGRPPGNPKHPLVAAMLKKGVTLVEVAEEVKRSRSTVQAWMAKGDNHRPIPEDAKKYLNEKYGVPYSAWKKQ